uniref:Quercetin 3-O-glucoside-6''-O-malonyltransferase n=1 Tax=Verbena hybrida TaxID=76714 RepID=Q6RFS7_VERHY|nr:quercetin 3-O-glucoside-6''-O-malonyltransferase [Glandularia x hybrida]
MATTTRKVTVRERCGIAPPADAGEAVEQRLPITYFDTIWLYFHPIQRLLFYQYPCSKTHFVEHLVPNLKKSLKQTLRHYRPLAGKLIRPVDSGMPELRYSPGDSVSVTFAETNGDFDFNHLTGNHVRDSDEFYSFAPDLPEPVTEPDPGFTVVPLFAIQVTLFPEVGICMGFTNHHAVGDASSIVGFIKSWSSVAKSGGDEILAQKNSLPFYDRSVIKDPSGRADILWNQMRTFQIGSDHSNFPTNRFRATFILRKHEIQHLKNLVAEKKPGLSHLSSFTVTTSYVWSCLAKASAESGEEVDETEPEYFGFAVDARHRMDPPAPAAYFGNCLAFVVVETTHGVLKGEDGFFTGVELVSEIISKKVNNKNELLRDAHEWVVKYGPIVGKRLVGVAGSPKFDLYDTDFGWGNPNKYESVSIDNDGSMSLCKSREFESGLEIGMSLPKKKMEAFVDAFRHGLKI